MGKIGLTTTGTRSHKTIEIKLLNLKSPIFSNLNTFNPM